MTPPRTGEVLLYSGGLDSFLIWSLLHGPDSVYVRLGHRYQADEEQAVADLGVYASQHLQPGRAPARWHKVIDGPDLSALEKPDGYIPQRNLLLATLAAQHGDTVILGATAGEASPDKTRRFLRDASRALSTAAGHPVAVVAPFRHLTKTQLVRRYLQQTGDHLGVELLTHTRSCYTPGTQACGQCMACFRRWVALTNNGIFEEHDHDPREWIAGQLSVDFAWSYLRRVPVSEWPAILRNQMEARRALNRLDPRDPGQ